MKAINQSFTSSKLNGKKFEHAFQKSEFVTSNNFTVFL